MSEPTGYLLKAPCSHCGQWGVNDVTLVCSRCGEVHEITPQQERARDADIALVAAVTARGKW